LNSITILFVFCFLSFTSRGKSFNRTPFKKPFVLMPD
jgi:hypothetical protein